MTQTLTLKNRSGFGEKIRMANPNRIGTVNSFERKEPRALANRAPSQGYSTAACSAMGEHARRRGTSRRRHLHLLHCCSFLGGAGTRRRGRREKEKERPGGATVEQLRRPASSAVATAAAVLGTERESKQRNGLGFRGARPAGLLMPRAVRSTARSGSTARSARAKIGPGGIGREAEFPAQA